MKTMNCLCTPKTKREGTQPYQVLVGMQPSRSGLRSLEEILSGTAPLGASLTASYKVQDSLGSYGAVTALGIYSTESKTYAHTKFQTLGQRAEALI